jgi:3-hydroxymyristoyl/3-hydroxydecanoyl-(acyl carrier protein) dehydratase
MSNPDLVLLPVFKRVTYLDGNEVVVELFIPDDLAYFNGHFDRIAVVPGVTQIHWVVHYAQLHIEKFVDADQAPQTSLVQHTELDGFYQMQVIKFKSLMLPKTTIHLSLRSVDDGSKLYFRFYSETQEFSSGRLYFQSA